jgi:hypothetical protein
MKVQSTSPPCPSLLLLLVTHLLMMVPASDSLAQSSQNVVPTIGQRLTDAQAAQLAKLALSGLNREFPNKPNNVVTSPETVLGPKQLHPAFFGCFDWHSSVHGHWMLVRLLKLSPSHQLSDASRKGLAINMTEENLQAEAKYFDEKENKSFERMYGWAWLLRLVAELHEWDDPMGQEWRVSLKPIEAKVVELTMNYLPKLKQPIRTGVHPDTAFALGQILDYAKIVGNRELEVLVVARARDYYLNDRDYNSEYEPSGEDFFSPSLNEADLMRRVLPTDEFARWLTLFLPDLKENSKSKLLDPVLVSDVTDGKLVHLAGLDLSRAWCMQGIASGLPREDLRIQILRRSASEHARAGFGYVFSGHYEGEHWLGTFAVYALTML